MSLSSGKSPPGILQAPLFSWASGSIGPLGLLVALQGTCNLKALFCPYAMLQALQVLSFNKVIWNIVSPSLWALGPSGPTHGCILGSQTLVTWTLWSCTHPLLWVFRPWSHSWSLLSGLMNSLVWLLPFLWVLGLSCRVYTLLGFVDPLIQVSPLQPHRPSGLIFFVTPWLLNTQVPHSDTPPLFRPSLVSLSQPCFVLLEILGSHT